MSSGTRSGKLYALFCGAVNLNLFGPLAAYSAGTTSVLADGTLFHNPQVLEQCFELFRSIVFIGMHRAFWLAFWDRNHGF